MFIPSLSWHKARFSMKLAAKKGVFSSRTHLAGSYLQVDALRILPPIKLSLPPIDRVVRLCPVRIATIVQRQALMMTQQAGGFV
jgi:hypothetical protein